MKVNSVFEKHGPKLFREAILRSALCGISVGFVANFIAALATWFSSVNGLWISIGVFVVVSSIASLLFYFKRFRPSDIKNARRLDSMGLDERLVTMVDFRNDSSYIANLQRNDAKAALDKIDIKRVKMIIPRAIVVSLVICAFIGTGMTTVNALSENGVLPGGDDIIDGIVEDQTTEYVSVTYAVMAVPFNYDEGGVIEGDEEQIIVKGTDASTVTAVADEGYVFKEWSDGYASPTRTDTEISEDVIYIAIFTELGDGEGDGEGGDGDGEEGDAPSDAPSDSSEDGEGDSGGSGDGAPNDGGAGGSVMDPNNLIINNDEYYRDVIERLNEETTERLESNDGSLTQEEIDMIKKYLGIV